MCPGVRLQSDTSGVAVARAQGVGLKSDTYHAPRDETRLAWRARSDVGRRRPCDPRARVAQLRTRLLSRRGADRARDVPRVPPRRRHRTVRVPDGARPREPGAPAPRGARATPDAALAAVGAVATVRRPGAAHPRRPRAPDARPLGTVAARPPRRSTTRDADRPGPRSRDRAAAGRVTPRPGDVRRLSAVGDERLHGRLPLLPPRPEAHPGRVRDIRADRARRRRHRASRHPLPHPAGVGRAGDDPRPPLTRRGLDVLRRPRRRRRHERQPARVPRRRRLDRGLGPRLRCRPLPPGHRRRPAGGEPDRDAGALQPARTASARIALAPC